MLSPLAACYLLPGTSFSFFRTARKTGVNKEKRIRFFFKLCFGQIYVETLYDTIPVFSPTRIQNGRFSLRRHVRHRLLTSEVGII